MKSNILLVDDNPGMIQVMGRILSGVGQIRFATSGDAALQQMRKQAPDLVLLDAEMPGMTGYEVCEIMKADLELRDIPVIFVTSHSGPDFELKGLHLGAVDFIGKPISEPLLIARVQTQLRVKSLTDELKRIATIDALTEVANRRSFDESLAREWKRCQRSGDPICLLMLDVDHFKQFNDRYGHPSGDACLRQVAQALCDATLRPADLVARYGGEEFAILLPQTPQAGAELLAQRMLDAVEMLGIPHEASLTANHVTVSIGIGCFDADSAAWDRLSSNITPGTVANGTSQAIVHSADRALYAAKAGGRAQAWCLSVADAEKPEQAHEIAPWSRLPAKQLAA